MENQIILYQAENETTSLEVRLEDETVWLTQNQIIELFDSSKANISEHITNIFRSGELKELATVRKIRTVQIEGNRKVSRELLHYNLDMIISIGYRVNSIRGTQFRIWANQVLKDYLLKGHAVNHRIDKLETEMHDVKNKLNEVDFHIKTALPPSEGIFFNGQIFDAYVFVTDLIKSAKQSVILIDNYVDETVLTMLAKRNKKVSATIYTARITKQLTLDLQKHNQQYPNIDVKIYKNSHDRFLIIDEKHVYHIGASLKDLGKKWFAFSKINIPPSKIMENLPK
jgi:hypothetical protein